MQPLFISKFNTVAQLLLACAVLAQLGADWYVPRLTDGLAILVAASTFLSGAAYVITWGRKAILMERGE
jgi:cardiolipin synthase